MFRFSLISRSIRFPRRLDLNGVTYVTSSRRLTTQSTQRDLTSEQATRKVEELTSLIRAAQAAYYNTPNTLIDDDQFDMLFGELVELETKFPHTVLPNSPTSSVGFEPPSLLLNLKEALLDDDAFLISTGRKKRPVILEHPMQSLKSIFDEQSVSQFVEDILSITPSRVGAESPNVVVEVKFDGIALSLSYHNGSLTQVSTRGNGSIGENVTERVLALDSSLQSKINLQVFHDSFIDILEKRTTLSSSSLGHISTENLSTIKQSLFHHPFWQGSFTLRCEGVCTRSSFQEANMARQALGLSLFSNPRNAISGAVIALHPSPSGCSPSLTLFCYSLLLPVGTFLPEAQIAEDVIQTFSHSELLQLVRSLGFNTDSSSISVPITSQTLQPGQLQFATSPSSSSSSPLLLSPLYRAIQKRIEDRKALDFDTDGLVLKVDSTRLQKCLGTTSRVPRWAVALKIAPDKAITTLQNIRLQVGRSGRITPVADLRPVTLCGALVSKATLHHLDFLRGGALTGLTIGDTVVVERKGDVIPAITSRISLLSPKPHVSDMGLNDINDMPSSSSSTSSTSSNIPFLFTLPRNTDGVLLCPCGKNSTLVRGPPTSSIPALITTHSLEEDIYHGSLLKQNMNTNVTTEPITHELVAISSDSLLYCRSPTCNGQWPLRLAHYVSRSALDVQGMSLKVIERLSTLGLVSEDPASIAALHFDPQIRAKFLDIGPKIEGLGERSVMNIIASVRQAHLTARLPQVLCGLGIRGLGATHANTLSTYFFHDICALLDASEEEIAEIGGFGPHKAADVTKSLESLQYTTLRTLALYGVPCLNSLRRRIEGNVQDNIVDVHTNESIEINERVNMDVNMIETVKNLLKDKHICFTGSMGLTKGAVLRALEGNQFLQKEIANVLSSVPEHDAVIPRPLLSRIMVLCGAIIDSSVGKSTQILFTAEAGQAKVSTKVSTKVQKAEERGVAVLSASDLLQLLSSISTSTKMSEVCDAIITV